MPGELFYMQLGLGGLTLGESALVVGPDGTIVAIDVGNNAHDDDVRDALDGLTAQMRLAGFQNVQNRTIDTIILTHHHADHSDGLEDLLSDVTVRRHIIHRGLTDITDAANSATVESICNTLAANAAADLPLCEGPAIPSCNANSWTGTYPSTGCPGLLRGNLDVTGGTGPSYIPLGSARVELLAADATVGDARYEVLQAPLLTSDSNGENARSVTAVIAHGGFRILVAGDLTGGGSDTDPVEAFVAARLPSAVLARGVDVLHVSHHGRDTSSSTAWLDALLPMDGRHRNAVMGISTAHAGSPHASVLGALLGGRLGDGTVFTTRVAPGGTSNAALADAEGGTIRIRTENGGRAYFIQALSEDQSVNITVHADSVHTCR